VLFDQGASYSGFSLSIRFRQEVNGMGWTRVTHVPGYSSAFLEYLNFEVRGE
jgi:hypothetical protein